MSDQCGRRVVASTADASDITPRRQICGLGKDFGRRSLCMFGEPEEVWTPAKARSWEFTNNDPGASHLGYLPVASLERR